MAFKYNGVEPTVIKYNDTDLTVLKYSVREGDLSGEATRASVSSYSKAALDGYVGLVNDTWGGITNASSLTKDKYYYIRVLVTDTNRYGKFCVRFKSYNGQTITTDNIGWGYDGEVIAAIPVWGKPFPLTIQAGANSTVTVNRTSSPNQHASTGNITSGGLVYYGDTLTITATPASGYKLTKFTINGTEHASGQTSAVSQTITVTGAVSVVTATQSAKSWHTAWSGSYTLTTKVFSFVNGTPITLNRTYVNQGNIRITGYSSVDTTTRTQQMTKSQYYTTWGSAIVVAVIEASDSSSTYATFQVSTQDSTYGSRSFTITKIETYGSRSFTITKIEYYY